jgi:hypothetical protein
LKSSLRAGSRRNETRGIRAAAITALFCCAPLLAAESLDVAFKWDRERELVAALRDGMESRITLTLRLCARRAAFLPLLADAVIAEKSLSSVAFFDFLDKRFVVESETGGRRVFDEPEEMVRGFFSWKGVALGAHPGAERPYLCARVQFDPVCLIPPLAIVSLAGAAGTYTSPWIRREARP